MAATGLASLLAMSKSSPLSESVEEEEPVSKQLEILMERRRQEEVRKARYHWSLLRNSIHNTIAAVKESDVKNHVISHGIHHLRNLNHHTILKQVFFIKELKEYLTTDGQCVRFFMNDGRKKKTFTPEEPVDHISYCAQYKQYVGWITGGDELFLMDKSFEIISQSRAPSKIVLADYNTSTGEYITVGPGYFVTWAFRYGARHLIPRKMNRTEFKENKMFTHMVLESTASRSQKIFLSVGNSIVVYNVFEGNVLSYRKNLHEREITALTFFNPLKYLVTGALDGTIKIWDNKWHVQMVFVGHTGLINALDIYPHGSAIISASADKTIRVWNLDTCDEMDRTSLDEPVVSLQTMLDYDVFLTYSGKTVSMWRTQHLYHIHTSVGQRVMKIKHTSHPNYSLRTVMLSRDSSVRIVSPVTGDVITTLLLSPSRSIVDYAYAVEDETLFTVMTDGSIIKARTDTNPCRVIKEWKYNEPKEACNYLLVYEYVVDIQLDTDKWNAVQRGVTTKAITATEDGKEEDDDDDNGGSKKKKRNVNRTLLLGGRKDGYICVFNWHTGKVEFKIDAHGTKGVMSMIANSKVDQLISAGLDNVIKVWRVYPFVQESLAPLMSFFCAHLPLHMTMIKTHLCVGFQDHATATYSIVMYNLRDRKKIFDEGDDYRFDHEPGDDHTDTITGITACPRMKLYASSSSDGTIRIWDETNKPVRVLKLKSTPYSVGFCSPRGDLMVGIGKHMYQIPYYTYLPKAYLFRMVSMKFTEPKHDKPIPEDPNLTQKMSKTEISRLKNSHSSFKFSTYTDLLTEEELEEINRERLIKEKAFSILQKRESELTQIRDGDLISNKKPKSTNYTKNVAFKNYMKMYYDKPKPEVRKDDPYPMDTVQERVKEPEEPEETSWQPEREPNGFFPPASESVKPEPNQLKDSPLKAAYHIRLNGFIPNSILVKLLWPQQATARLAQKKRTEWKLPSFSAEQLDQINKAKKAREEEEQKALQQGELDRWPTVTSWRVKPKSRSSTLSRSIISRGKSDEDKQVSFLDEEDADISGRIMEMDWGDDEEPRVESPIDIYESPKEKKAKKEVEPPPKSTLMNKFADIMTRSPTPPPKVEELSKESTISGQSTVSEKPPSPRPPSTPKVKPTKPIVKHISKPPTPVTPPALTPPPKVKTPVPSAARLVTPSVRAKTPSPPPPPRPSTPLPSYITQFKGVVWFDKVFPSCDEHTFPKPWTIDNFVLSLVRMIKVADYEHKTPLLEAVLMLYEQYGFSDGVNHSVCKAVSGVLNDQKDPPTCIQENQRNFIATSLKALHKLGPHDKEFIAELLVQFLDGDKEVRGTVLSIVTSCGLQDPHRLLPKELDSWDIWNVEENDRHADLHKMCLQWLDRWMTSYKLHLEDAIERMKKGQNIHGRMSRDQYKKKGGQSANKSILRRSVGVGGEQDDGETDTTIDDQLHKSIIVTFDKMPDPSLIENATYIDAMNYFCDMMMEKELEAMRAPGKKAAGSKENVVQAKNTVLVLPKIPHKPALVRLGETHTSTCRPHRETNLHIDYRLPPVTARGYPPIPGQISGFVNSINLPMKSLNLNPFPNILNEFDARFQDPILITLKSSQKYFIPSQSVVPQEAIAAAL